MPGATNSVPTLTDRDVVLRAHSEDDFDDIVQACRDPESRRWTTVPEEYTLDDAKRWVRHVSPAGWDQDSEWGFAIEALDPASGRRRFAGNCALRNLGGGRAEIAYLAHPWARGTGVMTRAMRLLLAWGFAERDVQMVVWYAHVGNWASRRLAWKIGFTYRGMIPAWSKQRGALIDTWVGSLLAGQPTTPATTWLEAPMIVGDRVTLRPVAESDISRVVEALNDPEIRRWLPSFRKPYTQAEARAWHESCLEAAAAGSAVTWAISDPGSDHLLGVVNLFAIEPGRAADVGYWVHPEARGRGVATEATRLALRHAFVEPEDGGLGLRVVRARTALDNETSQRVLLRAGMTRAGTSRRATMLEGDVLGDAVHLRLHRRGARRGLGRT